MEIANANDDVIENNTVIGDGSNGGDQAFSANSGSLRSTVRFNNVTDVRILYADPRHSTVTDNCLTHVQHIWYYGSAETSVFQNNGPC